MFIQKKKKKKKKKKNMFTHKPLVLAGSNVCLLFNAVESCITRGKQKPMGRLIEENYIVVVFALLNMCRAIN